MPDSPSLFSALRACVDAGFADVPGYTRCRRCLIAHGQAGVWWDEKAGRATDHDEDCPLRPFSEALELLEAVDA